MQDRRSFLLSAAAACGLLPWLRSEIGGAAEQPRRPGGLAIIAVGDGPVDTVAELQRRGQRALWGGWNQRRPHPGIRLDFQFQVPSFPDRLAERGRAVSRSHIERQLDSLRVLPRTVVLIARPAGRAGAQITPLLTAALVPRGHVVLLATTRPARLEGRAANKTAVRALCESLKAGMCDAEGVDMDEVLRRLPRPRGPYAEALHRADLEMADAVGKLARVAANHGWSCG